MSLETRLKNILDLQEEKKLLVQKLEELKRPKEPVIKVEESPQDESIRDPDVKPEVKKEAVALELEVYVSDDSEEGDSGDDLFLEHFVTDKKTYREIMLKKLESENLTNNQDEKEANTDIIKQELDFVDEEKSVGDDDGDNFTMKVEEIEQKVSEDSEDVQEILNQLLISMFDSSSTEDTENEEVEEEDTIEKTIDSCSYSEALAYDILETVFTGVWRSIEDEDREDELAEEVKDELEDVGNDKVEDLVEASKEADCDILDATWSETGKFVKVVGQDESAEEAEIMRIFESGCLTKTRLVESLPELGWVSCEDSAEFLPPGWFMRLDTNTFMETGDTTFFFITDKFHICLSTTSAFAYLQDNHYSGLEIAQFEQHFGI